jgi:RNA polymerase sigma-70 factor (ECF subfamily)
VSYLSERPVGGAEESVSRSQWSEAEFEGLFRHHFVGVFRLLFRIVGSRAEAEDLAQETFLRCYRDADPGLGDSLRPWLYRVAMNLAFNSRRDRKRREARHEKAERLEEADADRGARDPIDSIVRDEEREAVRRALARLDPRRAKLLLLRHAGLSYREVAIALDIALGSVGTLLARAEAAFEEQYRLMNGNRLEEGNALRSREAE